MPRNTKPLKWYYKNYKQNSNHLLRDFAENINHRSMIELSSSHFSLLLKTKMLFINYMYLDYNEEHRKNVSEDLTTSNKSDRHVIVLAQKHITQRGFASYLIGKTPEMLKVTHK